MSTQIQWRRGTTAEHSTFTGALGEVTVDTTKDVVVVHDGTTVGGIPSAKESHLHAGVYEPADATILKNANIGVTVQAYDVDIPTVSASQAEMEAGTEVALRSMSPLRVAQAIAALAASTGHGQCQLIKSGATLRLNPLNGNKLIIDGVTQTVPAAGITLAAPATTNTTYYIYAYMNVGVMTLEASTTTYATATNGVRTKSGDVTRTLVGMARTVSSAWVDTSAQRFVESWFNRPVRYAINTFTADRSTTSASFVELNSEIRAEWVSFNTQVHIYNSAVIRLNSGSAQVLNAGIGVDDATVEVGYMTVYADTAGATAHINASNETTPAVTEGYHYATMLASISSGGTLTAYSTCAIIVTLS